MRRLSLVLLLLGIIGLGWIASMGSALPTSGVYWKLVGGLTDGASVKFVEISPDRAKDRAVYDDAVSTLCRDESGCLVMFFLRGDRVPPTQSAKSMSASGGYRNYPRLAIWWVDHYSGWDCERAGVEGAPLDHLCGEGIRETHRAILSLAGRTGMAEYCGWPKNKNDPSSVMAYIAKIEDTGRREQFRRAFDEAYRSSTGGLDDPQDCIRLRPKIEKSAAEAREVLARTGSTTRR